MQLDATIQMLVRRLQWACDQPERSQQQLTELFKHKRVLQHRLAALEKSEKEAQANCERQRRLSDKATNSAVRLRTENNRLKAEVEKLTKGRAAAEDALDKLRAQAERLERDLAERSGQLRETTSELQRMREKERVLEREREVSRERRDREKQARAVLDGKSDKLADDAPVCP